MKRLGFALATLFLFSCSASPTTKLEPVTTPEAGDACPAGLLDWSLEITDHRAERDRVDGASMTALLSDSIRRSFPGCRWEASTGQTAPVIRVEVWQFRSAFEDRLWEARAVWSVEALPATGARSSFEVEERVSRPSYRGSDNEMQALKEVFGAAMKKTVEGLRSVPSRG